MRSAAISPGTAGSIVFSASIRAASRYEPDNVRTLIHPEDWQRLQAALASVTEDGQTFQTEFRVLRPNGETRWCIGAAAASVDASRRVVGLSGVTVDITDRKSAEERQTLLVREVDHRARNALAVVQSIIRLTRAESKEAYVAAVEGRITALSRAHVLLSQSRWQGANLSRILDEELAPYRRSDVEKIVTAGPEVFLEPATAQILALALHELATNAAKYGALSSAQGSVRLSWELGRSRLVLQWVESGGPSVQRPRSEGYGTRVIGASVERQLDGSALFDWHPEGLRFTMSIPLGEKARAQDDGQPRPPRAATAGNGAARVVPGNRLLLVEDEALTGMMMSDMLTELGFRGDRPVRPRGGCDGGGRAGGFSGGGSRRQSRWRDGLSGRRGGAGARRAVCVRDRIQRRGHRPPVRPDPGPAKADRAADAPERLCRSWPPRGSSGQ